METSYFIKDGDDGKLEIYPDGNHIDLKISCVSGHIVMSLSKWGALELGEAILKILNEQRAKGVI